jgi:signal transduction histidine kinase/ActR/RegA family two-component response regulator
LARRRGIRWHLLQAQLVSIVPIGLFAASLLYLHWQVQTKDRQQSQIESVRLLAAAVDNALDSTVERLSILARMWAWSELADEAIHAHAQATLIGNRDWKDVFAIRADGSTVFRAGALFGPRVPAPVRRALWRPLFEERHIVVSDVFVDLGGSAPHVAVGVPVVRDGRVVSALAARLDPTWYDRLLREQGHPEGAVAALLDRHFKFVARSSDGNVRRGREPTPELIARMKSHAEGFGKYVNAAGTPVYVAWTVTRRGWSVTFATPSAPVDHAFWSHLIVFALLWSAAVGAGVLYASAKARSIASSLESLEQQAVHFATGRTITGIPASQVDEVSRALLALERASKILQSATGERDRSLETEREARAAAEAANHAKDEFLAMLGHELRNPLAAISTAATIMQSERRDADHLAFATSVIDRQSRHLKRLIDDLLDVGRAMTGKVLLACDPLELAATARHVVETLQVAGRLTDRRVELLTTPVWVDGDATRIEQILTNLLVNADRYTVPNDRIRVRVDVEQRTAVLQVADDGQGIAPRDIPRVFDLFFQAQPTADRAAGGLGIGLTLVQRLAALHGGTATAESAGPGCGATFTVRLPAVPAPSRVKVASQAVERAHGETVLIVEDNTDARESLSLTLELRGYHVVRAADGAAALMALEHERPDVAILDIGLPGMEGYELATRVRAKLGCDVYLIALTGYGATDNQIRARRAGFDRYMTKPVDLDDLLKALDRALRAQAARDDTSLV